MHIDQKSIESLKQFIYEAKKVLITGHISPDGDAVGSSIALSLLLKKIGKDVTVMMPNKYTSMLNSLPHVDEVVVMEENKQVAIKMIQQSDLIFSLDYNTYDRVSAMKPILEQSKAVKVLIDHHLYPADYYDITISHPEISSTSELVYRVIEALGYKEYVDKSMAECIYTGMMTDTGNFSYNSNKPGIYTVIGELVERGIDKDAIYKRIFNNSTEDRLRLVGFCLSTMVVLRDIETAYICLSLEDQERFNFQIGDAEGIVNMPLQIQGICKSVMLKEEKDMIKLSFRSEGDVYVNSIAEHFGGGGHKNAAGGESRTTMEATLEKLLPLMQ